ncbi:hypothetical protein HAX54_006890 [Datura stramonium]|uniref:Uncharacterized protein n=1 Tax=Datura stramonium TaxID=4076 RepID=A0ABS8TAV3_DATST|nr:hypothetical protein [Datura stramonium]
MGRRARIPSQKALMAKRDANKGNVKGQKRKQSVKEAQVEIGSKVTRVSPVPSNSAGPVRTTKELSAQKSAGSSTRKSWADEVEQDLDSKDKKELIREKFDINKISNAGFKLKFVPPAIQVSNSEYRIGVNPITWAEVMEFQNYVDGCGLLELLHQGQRPSIQVSWIRLELDGGHISMVA